MTTHVTSSDEAPIAELCDALAARAADLDRSPRWPAEQLRLCGESGVYRWFLDRGWGGFGWSEEQVVRGYLALSAACLTTTFIITQRTGACRRIAGSQNETLKQLLLPRLASGEAFATVGISHLTTSGRHLAKPALTATPTPQGFRLDGASPWVTGAAAADTLVLGATVVERDKPTDRELLVAVPADLPGVTVDKSVPLVGLTASCTGPVFLKNAIVSDDWLIAGPTSNVMAGGLGGRTGGHETSTLAIGLAGAAINYLEQEAARRPDLQSPVDALASERFQLHDDLLNIARGREVCSKESLRSRANSLVLRAAQAALAAAKGRGYVVGHPAGRWCREALFFLVWSCPQPVANANLCELAGLE